jgi:hypothetical protein
LATKSSKTLHSAVDWITTLIETFLIQYGAFLVIVLFLELAVAASTYAYRDTLNDGFDLGLNQTMQEYGPDAPVKSNDFDAMQSTVSGPSSVEVFVKF